MLDRTPITCPECGLTKLRKLAGRQDHEHDERWICPNAINERKVGADPAKRIHSGLVYDVAYILRGQENRKALEEWNSKEALEAAAAGRPARGHTTAMPGDVVVARDMRAVYVIDPDGSRRRCRDLDACEVAIDRVKELLSHG